VSAPRPSPHLAAAIAGPLALAVAAAVGAALQPAYSSRREDLSALAATDARWSAVMAAGIVATGLAVLVVAAALWRRRDGRGPAAALVLGGLAVVATGLLPIDCSERADAACRARIDAGMASWHDGAHNLAIVLAVAALAAAPLLAAAAPSWRGMRAPSAVAGVLTLAIYALYLADPLPGWTGAIERVGVAVPLAWIALAAARPPAPR
jgi:hypothetical membrane protein